MPKITDEELVRAHFHIYKRDYERLRQLTTRELSVAKIVRGIIRSFILHTGDQIERRIEEFEREERDSRDKSLTIDYDE